jgi:hypothetical protein
MEREDCSKVKGHLTVIERTTSEFEARADGWMENFDDGGQAG